MRGTIVQRAAAITKSSLIGPQLPLLSQSMAFQRPKVSTINNNGRRFYGRRSVPWVPPTYNELPVPFGSWEKDYQRNNARYNKHLAIGVGFFIVTIFTVSRVATFHFSPPPLAPLEIDDELCPPPEPKKCN